MDLQPIAPGVVVLLARVPRRRVVGKARRGDDPRPRPQHHQRRLIADLQPRPGDERDPPVQRRRLEALLVIELRAVGAHRVVEEVDPPELGLADVAVARLGELAGAFRRGLGPADELRRRDEHRRTARRADLGRRPRLAIRVPLLLTLHAPESLGRPHLLGAHRPRYAPRRAKERDAQVVRHAGETRAIEDERLEGLDAATDVLEGGHWRSGGLGPV